MTTAGPRSGALPKRKRPKIHKKRQGTIKPGGMKAEINVTPLVDVVLVLLIIFMVITPMLTRGREVQLPVAQAADAEHESVDAIVLTVAADKSLWLENHKISADSLVAGLKGRMSANPSAQTVLIKADASIMVK